MKCPECGLLDSDCKVIDSRSWKHTIRRRRLCSHCGHRWNTYEATEAEFFSDRNRNKYLAWSPGEEATAVRLRESGFTHREIGRLLGRSKDSVGKKMDKLLANDEYFIILEDLQGVIE